MFRSSIPLSAVRPRCTLTSAKNISPSNHSLWGTSWKRISAGPFMIPSHLAISGMTTPRRTNPQRTPDIKFPAWEKDYYGLQPPDVQITSFANWEEAGEWFNSLAQPKVVITPE